MNSPLFQVNRSKAAAAALLLLTATGACAADGCKFLLCIAGPWTGIPLCVPTVHEVFRDLALGRPFPICSMSGSGNSAGNTWVDEAGCPSMYRQYNAESGSYIGCTYPGRISVYLNGSLWSHVFWNMSGGTSTMYTDTARASLTQQPGALPLDDLFRNDLSAWNVPRVSHCLSGGGTVEFDAFGGFQRCIFPDLGGGE